MAEYNRAEFKELFKHRWNPYENKPIENASELCYLLRRVVNSDASRMDRLNYIFKSHNRAIIFYNFDYELEILKQFCEGNKITYSEWNGHNHQEIPNTNSWLYLVQYTAGAEGWNCITTDTIIFYSLNYSYKSMIQAAGRIDRMNTPFTDLYYFYLYSNSPIDLAIRKALANKKNFNERAFLNSR
jgi:superfamily II DNA or RNA helicase